jgi:hypothetical protein
MCVCYTKDLHNTNVCALYTNIAYYTANAFQAYL